MAESTDATGMAESDADKQRGAQKGSVRKPTAEPVATARVPDFAELSPTIRDAGRSTLDSLRHVKFEAFAILGHVTLTIEEILKLGSGSVVKLDSSISEPVDLIVQGVKLGRGEVVVVDDRYAVRIQEIVDPESQL